MTPPTSLFRPPVTRPIAAQILSDLKTGKPPHEYVGEIHVGYDALLNYFRQKLDEIREFGTSDVKFVNADYGGGKSHFLDLIRLLAFERDFVVSRVELNQTDTPFDKLDKVIQSMMRNVATAEFRKNGLEQVLRKWARDSRSIPERSLHDSLDALSMPQLRLKLIAYARAYNSGAGDPMGMAELMKWFRGEEARSKTFPSVREYLHDLTQFFRLIGYGGFVIMLDEAESISTMTRGARGEVANENIRQIIDNDRGTEGFYFVFASTPTFFAAPPGGNPRRGDPVSIYSYPALRRRVENMLGLMDPFSPESVIVELPKLTINDILELAHRIRDLAHLAYGEPATPITDPQLQALVAYVHMTDPRVATAVRSLVALCERARRPGFSFQQEFELVVEHEREQVYRQASEDAGA